MTTTRSRAAHLVLAAYLLVAAVLVLQHRGGSQWAYAVLTVSSAAAVAAGTALRRPSPTWPGWCLAGSLALIGGGDAMFAWYEAAGLQPFPSVADAVYLAGYLPLAAAVLGLGGQARVSRPLLLDATAVAVAVALPLWALVGAPAIGSGELPARLVGLAYPLADLVVLVLVAGLLLSRRSGPGDLLLAVGALGLVGSDVAFSVLTTHGTYASGGLADAGWCVQRVLWVTAALTPLRMGTRPRDVAVPGRRWLLGLGVLTATAPLSLLLQERPTRLDVLVITLGTVLLALVVLARLSGVARELRAAVARQQEDAQAAQAVAAAGGVLLGGLDTVDVRRAALSAVLQVLPDAGRAAVGIAEGPAELLELVAVDGTGLSPQEVAAVDLGLLGPADRRALAAGREVERSLDDPDRAQDACLVLPLAHGGRAVGAVLLVASLPVLERARPRLRLLAPQLALALDSSRRRETADRRRALPEASAGPSSPRPSLAADIVRGLRQDEFRVHYQPIVGLDDGRPRGFEALVRWQHPERGLLLPGQFLPQVEECGLLGQLDAAVLARACRDAVQWDRSSAGPYVSVNVSAEQLVDVRFGAQVRGVLLATGLPPWRLLVEVTEIATIADPEAVATVLQGLRAQRVRVAFDDFGTGYSSLSWLQQLPLDVVKIDRSFVDRLPQPVTERPVVEALVRLAQTMRLEVVAEGVEREEQREALAAMGVELGQGWLWSRAVPPEQVPAMLPARTAGLRDDDGRLVLGRA